MYHDQALIPIKTLAFDRGVNVTLGLPFVRTSPDHGTAFALAGTGKARPDSFIAALRLAAELGRRRAAARAAARAMSRERAAASPDGLPPLGEVIRSLGLVGAQEPGPELHPRPQPDAAHRARGRSARRAGRWSRSGRAPAG